MQLQDHLDQVQANAGSNHALDIAGPEITLEYPIQIGLRISDAAVLRGNYFNIGLALRTKHDWRQSADLTSPRKSRGGQVDQDPRPR